MRTTRAVAIACTAFLALGVSACSSTELDSRGRWVGGAKTMTSWADTHVPAAWDRIDQSVVYGDIIDDFGEDTHRDQTTFVAHYRDVSKRQFAAFGSGQLDLDQELQCEPADPDTAEPMPSPAVTSCYLDLYQGADPLPDEFDLFAVWTVYADHTTRVDLFLTNQPR